MESPKLIWRTWLPMLQRGCCCSLEVCCKVQGYLFANFSFIVTLVNVIVWVFDNDCRDNPWWCGPIWIPIRILSVIYSLIALQFSVLLLVGINQRRGSKLTPFLVLQYVQLILVLHFDLYLTVFVKKPVVSLVATIPVMAFTVYCLLCVNSLRVQYHHPIESST